MPVERAGYTVTMFLVDVSPSMGNNRTLELPPNPDGESYTTQITNLEWALQFVKLKIQEMIYNGRKTDQCGVIIFGSEDTSNIINDKHGGYEHVSEFIPIGQPNASTLTKLDTLRPSRVAGDPIDALIVGIETQAQHLASKKTWTRKIVLVTDGEGPIEVEDWEATADKMNNTNVMFTLVGVDFDDEDFPYTEPNKSTFKKANEDFYHHFVSKLDNGVIGTCALALREISRPDIRQVKSVLMGTILRLGEVDTKPDEAIEIMVKSSKCTAISRPKGWKKFAVRPADEDDQTNERKEEDKEDGTSDVYAQLRMRTEYFVDTTAGDDTVDKDGDIKMEHDEELLLDGVGERDDKPEGKDEEKDKNLQKVDKEQLVKGFKYGTSYVPCPDGQFARLPTVKGIDICGFFPEKNFRREHSMGEIQYIWADPASPQQQVALSSVVQAMYEKGVMAIARWVTKDGMDPKMGVLKPAIFKDVDCLLWAQMPFADDVRKYTFASLENLVARNGEKITEHPYLPTEKQLEAMEHFVDCMDLSDVGDKDVDGNRQPWFETLLSYNPAIHRTKQALFHSAVVSDLTDNPLPPPHPELLKYFNPPKRALKRSRDAYEECKDVFNVKEVPKKIARARQDGHEHATEADDDLILLDRKGPVSAGGPSKDKVPALPVTKGSPPPLDKGKGKARVEDSETEPESEIEEESLLEKKKLSTPSPAPLPPRTHPLPTPARSVSPLPSPDADIDPGRAPGRIIGTTYPLADFRKNLERGDMVTKAVEDLGLVITETVGRPFGSRRAAEMIEAMKVMRDTALQEDEIDAWNAFLQGLKKSCTSKHGNKEFWLLVKKTGRPLTLISNKEAMKHGGTSAFSDRQAQEFTS